MNLLDDQPRMNSPGRSLFLFQPPFWPPNDHLVRGCSQWPSAVKDLSINSRVNVMLRGGAPRGTIRSRQAIVVGAVFRSGLKLVSDMKFFASYPGQVHESELSWLSCQPLPLTHKGPLEPGPGAVLKATMWFLKAYKL